jgi:hypothetical protein
MAWQRARITIPKRFGPLERQAIAQEVIDYIIKRTKEGKKIDGKTSFPGYSPAYKKSLDYKIAGKTGTVDLTLSGELLDSIELLSHKSGEIIVGYQKGDKELNAKAEGNQIGSYGGKPNSKKARPYLGIVTGDLREILKRYPNDREESLTRAEEELAAAAEAGTIVDGIQFDPGADDGE